MQVRPFFFIVLLFNPSVFSQSPGNSSQSRNQAVQEQQFQLRRQNFETGRQLLLDKGVPFDPDELLREGWSTNLKAQLDSMPEMHQSRFETAPLKGAYFADTVYLPEKVHLSGHTLIVANHVVFEGKEPVIKGNFDIHFFATKPVTVLDTTLAEVMRERPELLRVKLDRRSSMPPFALIQDLVQTRRHVITFDTSGREPQALRPALQRPAARQQSVSWNELLPARFPFQDCSTGCDKSGGGGTTGSPGISPGPAPPGQPNGGRANDGTCVSGGNPDGNNGEFGGNGPTGTPGGNGGPGGPGGDASNINASVADGDVSFYNFIAHGGQGGTGGPGGTGGAGGNGGAGAVGGNGVNCACSLGTGGNGGKGGDAGVGAKGGTGGTGGPGGKGGTITISLPFNSPGASTNNSGGPAGLGGDPGAEGLAGNPGSGGAAGIGASGCGQKAGDGIFFGSGNSNSSLGPGDPGALGTRGQDGPSPSISYRQPPGGDGGAGGGGGDPCLGSGGGLTPGAGNGPDPTCSPIIIDAEREGFHLTSAITGVSFDISGTGHPIQIAWTDSQFHNAFLALPGSDGLVHNGKQLFGNFTRQPNSPHPNGFLALAQFDKPENGGNGDGIIDDKDAVFVQLRLWIDENHDGVCQPNELYRLPELGVYSLSISYGESRRTDEFGNVFRYRGRVNPGGRRDPRDETLSGEPGRWEYDVFLTVK